MALRYFGRRAVRLASAASRPLVPAAAAAWASPALGAGVGATAIQTRAFAKAKKSKGGKAKASAPAAVADGDDAGDEEDGGAAKALEKARKNMTGAVVNFTRALSQMRPGRADAGIFDELHVQAYGQHVPLAQVAQVAVVGTHALSVTVYDPSCPNRLSKETRAELLKATKKQAEQARQHVRRVRQDAMNHAKKLKDVVSEDDVEEQKERIQKVTDDAIEEIGKLLAAKEKDLNTV
ncbi:unnamed protein product [Phytophthora lilii]|uniref:Unnamed protein product n=1 Tax=Phytophthora lilii TaxID=2077276 RepID=A0A9W6WXE0_9STRA|nr:unnamed protein product [Phytophthora lilii]